MYIYQSGITLNHCYALEIIVNCMTLSDTIFLKVLVTLCSEFDISYDEQENHWKYSQN